MSEFEIMVIGSCFLVTAFCSFVAYNIGLLNGVRRAHETAKQLFNTDRT